MWSTSSTHRAAVGQRDASDVTLRLIHHGAHFAIERVQIRAGRPWLETVVPVSGREVLERLRSSDPRGEDDLAWHYDRVIVEYDRLAPPPGDVASGRGDAKRAEAALEVSACVHAAELDHVVRNSVAHTGADNYMFAVLHVDPERGRPLQYNYLCGYEPEWVQLYLHHRRWFVGDRSIELAMQSAEPVLGSRVSPAPPEFQEMLGVMREHGIASWMATPAFHRSRDWLGILYVASKADPRDGGEETLFRSHVSLSGLAGELLRWQLAAKQKEFAARYKLTPKELRILQLSCDGLTSGVVASRLDVSVRTVYDWNTSISDKLDVRGIKDAVIKARFEGLPT